ncbi:uncharacterized protein LOC115468079 [Microcaecilia unicolor]|uniref:Uncharacterized protein LOC115468079 n=1 Tax=Microcaecilia unicolor TaxID=1415580 RepID=A0A6P7XQU2_9AMPH|nr:uncharacterized protein LOC115468079 [Microcaecilia unicolor]
MDSFYQKKANYQMKTTQNFRWCPRKITYPIPPYMELRLYFTQYGRRPDKGYTSIIHIIDDQKGGLGYGLVGGFGGGMGAGFGAGGARVGGLGTPCAYRIKDTNQSCAILVEDQLYMIDNCDNAAIFKIDTIPINSKELYFALKIQRTNLYLNAENNKLVVKERNHCNSRSCLFKYSGTTSQFKSAAYPDRYIGSKEGEIKLVYNDSQSQQLYFDVFLDCID